jgi:hypothetical protein
MDTTPIGSFDLECVPLIGGRGTRIGFAGGW